MSQGLAARILDAFPSGTYSLAALLRIVDIVEDAGVPTAAVECRAQPRMRLNPGFMAQHAATPQKLLMLVMHELHHVLLGHTTLGMRMTPETNFVFDAVINGMLCRMFPAPEYTALLSDFYRDSGFPGCLLAPPPGWPAAGAGRAPGLQWLPAPLADRVHQLHVALYSEHGATYAEVTEVLPRLLQACPQGAGLDGVPLLGDHDGAQAPGDTAWLGGLLRETVPGLDRMAHPLRGGPLPWLRVDGRASQVEARPWRSALRDLLCRVAGQGGPTRLAQPGWRDVEVLTPLPRLHRRTLVQRALGLQPLLHPAPLRLRQPHAERDRVHMYVDVSGSMQACLADAYGAVLDCLPLLYPRVHLFSTEVRDVTLSEFRQGQCTSTGGNHITCVTEHMAQHGVRRAVLLTDGSVGQAKGWHAEVLQRVHLGVALLGSDDALDLEPYVDHLVRLRPRRSA